MAESKLTVQETVIHALLVGVGLVVFTFCINLVTGSFSETFNSLHLKPAIRVFFVGFLAGAAAWIIDAIIKDIK